MFLETKKLTIDKQDLDQTSKTILLTKPSFLDLEKEVSPLFALIVFCHTDLSQYCLDTIQKIQADVINCFSVVFSNAAIELLHKQTQLVFISCFSAMCCNGSIELFSTVFKDQVKESLSMTWGGLFPIHIVSVFHNYELLHNIIDMEVNVNLKMNKNGGWTPLLLAAGNDTQEYGDYYHVESGATRRDKTVQLLLSKGANINLCNN